MRIWFLCSSSRTATIALAIILRYFANLILSKSLPWDEANQADNMIDEREVGTHMMKYHSERNITEGLCIVEHVGGSHKIT
jgi:hypothetical protein